MKVLVSDFDHTLFTDDYTKNIHKINEFVDKGNLFIIATGRNLSQLSKDIEGRNIKVSYLICNDGGIIFDKNLNLVHRIDINPKTADNLILELQKDPNVTTVLYDDGLRYAENKTINTNAVLARYINPNIAAEKVKQLSKKYNDIHGYISFNWINIINNKVSKGNAIKYLTKLLNLDEQHIYTVGDGTNDVSMNKMFKGYSMEENSHPELIKVSKESVKSVNELISMIENKII